MNYIFDNAAEVLSTRRLDSIEALYDERTIGLIERTGLGAGWHCLEVGGGNGSIASWLQAALVMKAPFSPPTLTRASLIARPVATYRFAATTLAVIRCPQSASIWSIRGSCSFTLPILGA
jgi:hypothetical protein